MGKDENEMRGEIEERLINEEYKIWEKNTPFLYDMVVTHSLEWPSLTVEWLPDREEPLGKDYSVKKMILGAHTTKNEPNFLMLTQVQLSLEDAENDACHYDDDRFDVGGFGCANGKVRERVVEDVAWHLWHEYLFGSVGNDQYLHIWDLRSPSVTKPIQTVMAH